MIVTRKFLTVLSATTLLALGGVALTTDTASAAIVSATCNNTTTDAATIQAAINASHASDQIVIHGPCLINATIDLLDNRRYSGDGRGATVLKQANGANLKAMLASDSWVKNVSYTSSSVTIEHLTLDGNSANNTSTVPLVLRTWDSLVQDIEIDDAPSHAILVTNQSQNGTALTNTSVNSTIKDFFISNSGGAGLRIVDTGNSLTDWTVTDGWIASSGASAVDLDNAAGWQIRNLHIYGVANNAIDARRCFGTGIHDNYIEDFGDAGASGNTYYGIHCAAQGDASSVVSGNKVHMLDTLPSSGTYKYIGVDGNYGTPLLSVTGNTIRGQGTSRETGLSYTVGSATSMTIASTGNAVFNVGTPRSVGASVTVSAGY